MNEIKTVWRNLSGEIFKESIETLTEQSIKREQANGYRLKVCVGSDSQVYKSEIHYATAVMIVREGKGAFAFIKKEKSPQKLSIKERMLNEVSKSIEVAYSICKLLEKYNVEMEVHADINTDPEFESNIALKDAMGYILGMGFTFVAKPNAFASSSCADMVV